MHKPNESSATTKQPKKHECVLNRQQIECKCIYCRQCVHRTVTATRNIGKLHKLRKKMSEKKTVITKTWWPFFNLNFNCFSSFFRFRIVELRFRYNLLNKHCTVHIVSCTFDDHGCRKIHSSAIYTACILAMSTY